jgi:hypothetical protein
VSKIKIVADKFIVIVGFGNLIEDIIIMDKIMSITKYEYSGRSK